MNGRRQVFSRRPRIVSGIPPRQVAVQKPATVVPPEPEVPGMVVTLQGGLGNQMFQYAFGASVAAVRKEDLYFTRYRVDEDHKRSYSLGVFKGDLKFVPKEGNPCFSEDVFQYDPSVYTRPPKSSFSGHWQTEKYFNEALVRQGLALRNPVSAKTQQVAEQVLAAGSNSTFLHIRRGDYLWKENVVFHGAPTANYYNAAISHINERVGEAKFFVFSDEPGWCKTQFPNFTVIDHNKPGDHIAPGQEHEDLYLMSLCRHAIIANSSFSWWGAWLGDIQKDRIVIAPKKWFVVDMVTKDIIPDRWIRYDN